MPNPFDIPGQPPGGGQPLRPWVANQGYFFADVGGAGQAFAKFKETFSDPYLGGEWAKDVVVVSGPPGCGKSSLINRCAEWVMTEWNRSHGGGARIIDRTKSAPDPESLLPGLLETMRIQFREQAIGSVGDLDADFIRLNDVLGVDRIALVLLPKLPRFEELRRYLSLTQSQIILFAEVDSEVLPDWFDLPQSGCLRLDVGPLTGADAWEFIRVRVGGKLVPTEISFHVDRGEFQRFLARAPEARSVRGLQNLMYRVYEEAAAEGRREISAHDLERLLPPPPEPEQHQTASAPKPWEYVGFGALPERPSGYVSDLPAGQDLLGIGNDIRALARLIIARDIEPPLAIALVGDWGSGKSSAMLQMRQEIEKETAGQPDDGRGPYLRQVRQVVLNAWHYSDDEAWLGIIEGLFEELRAVRGKDDESGDPADDVERRRELRRDVEKLTAWEEDLKNRRDAVRRLRANTGELAGLPTPAVAANRLWISAREVFRDGRVGWGSVVGWAVIAVVVYAAWQFLQPSAATAISVVAALSASGLPFAQQIKAWAQDGGKFLEWREKVLDDKQRELQSSLLAARTDLLEIDAHARIKDFFADVQRAATYAGFRGLIGHVHHDLKQLATLMEEARREWAADQRRNEQDDRAARPRKRERREERQDDDPPLERVILYIDDLDRCPPSRVVDVLAAIHLLLALPLFVVVVGVDSRWLVRALDRHLRELMGATGSDGVVVTPAEYLDKIFQIPYSLPPLTAASAERLVRSLLQAREGDDHGSRSEVRPPVAVSNGSAESASRVGVAGGVPLPDAHGEEEMPPSEGSHDGGKASDGHAEALRLRDQEIRLLSGLAALLPTPRAVKKLINLYRLVRISVSPGRLEAFVGGPDGGPYQAVQVLLALLVGAPAEAPAIFKLILKADPGTDLVTMLTTVADKDRANTVGRVAGRFAAWLDDARAVHPAIADIALYQRYCRQIARYSFHTRDILGENAGR